MAKEKKEQDRNTGEDAERGFFRKLIGLLKSFLEKLKEIFSSVYYERSSGKEETPGAQADAHDSEKDGKPRQNDQKAQKDAVYGRGKDQQTRSRDSAPVQPEYGRNGSGHADAARKSAEVVSSSETKDRPAPESRKQAAFSVLKSCGTVVRSSAGKSYYVDNAAHDGIMLMDLSTGNAMSVFNPSCPKELEKGRMLSDVEKRFLKDVFIVTACVQKQSFLHGTEKMETAMKELEDPAMDEARKSLGEAAAAVERRMRRLYEKEGPVYTRVLRTEDGEIVIAEGRKGSLLVPVKDGAGKEKTDPKTGRPVMKKMTEAYSLINGRKMAIDEERAHDQVLSLSPEAQFLTDLKQYAVHLRKVLNSAEETPKDKSDAQKSLNAIGAYVFDRHDSEKYPEYGELISARLTSPAGNMILGKTQQKTEPTEDEEYFLGSVVEKDGNHYYIDGRDKLGGGLRACCLDASDFGSVTYMLPDRDSIVKTDIDVSRYASEIEKASDISQARYLESAASYISENIDKGNVEMHDRYEGILSKYSEISSDRISPDLVGGIQSLLEESSVRDEYRADSSECDRNADDVL